MNVHVSYKVHKTPDIEKEISHQIEKIQKRLHVFRPELVHLKAILEPSSGRRWHPRLAEPAPALEPIDGGRGRDKRECGDQGRV